MDNLPTTYRPLDEDPIFDELMPLIEPANPTTDQSFNLRKFDKSEVVSILERNFTHRDFSILNRKWKLVAVDDVAGLIMILLDMQQAEIDRLRKRVAELEGFRW